MQPRKKADRSGNFNRPDRKILLTNIIYAKGDKRK